MKVKNGDGSYAVSLGNVITILVIISSVAVLWGSMGNAIQHMESEIQLKADRELIETHLEYIAQQIEDIKETLNAVQKDVSEMK
tara:strand:+ start:180 stop:431 length:252 start_codon:yes stop_codon:yes gene_type:complete